MRSKRAALCLTALALGLGCSSSSGTEESKAALGNQAPTGKPTISVPLAFPDVSVQSEGGNARFSGLPAAREPGKPALPVKTVRVLVAPEADLSKVAVSVEDTQEQVLPGTYQVSPAEPVKSPKGPLWPKGVSIVDGKDTAIYGADALFPATNVLKQSSGQLHRFKIVEATVSPYRWNPVTGELRVISGGRLVVRVPAGTQASGEAASGAADQRFAAQLATLVSNFDEAIGAYRQAAPASSSDIEEKNSALTAGATGYAIITTAQIKNGSSTLGLFADAKIAHGYPVRLITESAAYTRANGTWSACSSCGGGWGGGVGNVAADHIRAWLRANYISANLAYVLLIGDPTPATGSVPMKSASPFTTDDVPTDFYYADLSGTWDFDGDGHIGEIGQDGDGTFVGGYDRYAEVSVGRIPYYGVMGDLDHILAKSIAYGNAASSSIGWRKNAMVAIRPISLTEPNYQFGEYVLSQYLAPNGFTTARVYDQGFGVSPEVTPCNYDTVTSHWRAHRGLVVWYTHGSSSSAVDIMDSSRAADLDDLYPSFTVQNSCDTGAPENNENLSYALLRNGAIGTVGATREVGFATHMSSPENSAAPIMTGYTKHIARGLAAGDALTSAHMEDVDGWANSISFNLYGDPSLGLASTGTGAIQVPAAPTLATPTAGEGKVTLSWGAVAAAQAYTVKRATSSAGPFTAITTTSSVKRSYQDVGLNNGTTYYYVVTSVGPGTESPNSNVVSAKPTGLLAVQIRNADPNTGDNLILPYLKVVNTGSTSLALSGVKIRYWFTDENPGAMTVTCDSGGMACNLINPGQVVRSDQLLSKADSYLEIGFAGSAPTLAPGATSGEIRIRLRHTASVTFAETNDYSYDPYRTTFAGSRRLTAYVAGNQVWGDAPSGKMMADAPSYVLASPGNGSVTINWATGLRAVSYNVYRQAPNGPQVKVDSPTGPPTIDRGVSNGTSYQYIVSSVSVDGIESSAWASTPVTPDASKPSTPPQAPTGLNVFRSSVDHAEFDWNGVSGDLFYYNVKRATSPTGPWVNVGPLFGSTTAVLKGLDDGSTTYIAVTAVNFVGESPMSTALMYKANTLPRVIGVSGVAGDGQVTINWTAVAGATGYVVKRMDNVNFYYRSIATTGGPSYTDSGLTNGIGYTYVVAATNAAGEGLISDGVTLTPTGYTPPVPGQVTGLAATPGNAQVRLDWATVSGATGYVVRRQDVGGAFQIVGNSASNTYLDSPLTNGVAVIYTVSATNTAGEGPQSVAVSATPNAPSSEPCSPAQTISGGQSGNFNTTGSVCLRTADPISGWGCSNFDGRTVKVNGVLVDCASVPLPAKVNDYYYFDISAGTFPWASIYWWR